MRRPTARRRLDAELVRRGLCVDVDDARRVVAAGEVLVDNASAPNPGRLVAPAEVLALTGPPPRFVGRGGEKLAAALLRFGLDLTGLRVLDVGSSTGGFTDCALQAGATSVVAVDVGRGQLHQRLRADARVEVHEQTNIRHLAPGDLGAPADLVVGDLSFISLRTVADAVIALAGPASDLLLLVKPQFEAGRDEVTAGRGVITDPEIWRRVLADTCSMLERRRAAIMGAMSSPLRGAEGNVEFFVLARLGAEAGSADARIQVLVDTAVAEVTVP